MLLSRVIHQGIGKEKGLRRRDRRRRDRAAGHTACAREPSCALGRSPEKGFEPHLGPACTQGFYSSSSAWDTLSERTICTSLSPPGDGQHPVRDKRKENGAQRQYTEKKRCLRVRALPTGAEQDTRSPGAAQSAPRHVLSPPRTRLNGRACSAALCRGVQ